MKLIIRLLITVTAALAGGCGADGDVALDAGVDGGCVGAGCVAGTACSMQGGGTALAMCQSSLDCACPDLCVDDPYLSPIRSSSVCEHPCQTSLDCPDLGTSCQSGFCQLDPCGPSQGNADAACTTIDHQPGSCIDYTVDPANSLLDVWTCALAGTATTSCDPVNGASRTDLSARCAAGLTCDADNDDDQCVPLCDPTQANACTNGFSCMSTELFGGTGFCGP